MCGYAGADMYVWIWTLPIWQLFIISSFLVIHIDYSYVFGAMDITFNCLFRTGIADACQLSSCNSSFVFKTDMIAVVLTESFACHGREFTLGTQVVFPSSFGSIPVVLLVVFQVFGAKSCTVES